MTSSGNLDGATRVGRHGLLRLWHSGAPLVRAILVVFLGALPATLILAAVLPMFFNRYGQSLFGFFPSLWILALAWFILGTWSTWRLWLASVRPVTRKEIPALGTGIVALTPVVMYFAYAYFGYVDIMFRFSWIVLPIITAAILIVIGLDEQKTSYTSPDGQQPHCDL